MLTYFPQKQTPCKNNGFFILLQISSLIFFLAPPDPLPPSPGGGGVVSCQSKSQPASFWEIRSWTPEVLKRTSAAKVFLSIRFFAEYFDRNLSSYQVKICFSDRKNVWFSMIMYIVAPLYFISTLIEAEGRSVHHNINFFPSKFSNLIDFYSFYWLIHAFYTFQISKIREW